MTSSFSVASVAAEPGLQQPTSSANTMAENVPFANMRKKNYSQYDLVKVKVSLEDHFYVFSRFLMSRILTLIKVNDKDSIKITLDIKKHFVENKKTEVSQEELEQILFEKLREFQYGERLVSRYQLVTRFY